MGIYNLVSACGLICLIFLAYLLSSHKAKIGWGLVLWGIAFQLLFAVFVFVIPVGTKIFLLLNEVIIKVIDCASTGSQFLFGRLALPPGSIGPNGETSLGFFLAFQAFPTIIFFASVMAILHYYGVISFFVKRLARLFTKLMRISGAESLCVISNIFVGVESALVIKPYLSEMTESELCTILTAGMATIASSVMALYVVILKDSFPSIAGHLVSASILSAPAAVVMSKLILPEKQQPKTWGLNIKPHFEKTENVMLSIIGGANDGIRLIVGIVALLLAFMGLVSVFELIVQTISSHAGKLIGINVSLSLPSILGYIFYPLTLMVGVPPKDVMEIATIIGERLVLTEVKSYQDLSNLISSGALSDMRSVVIATYGLCGFAHIASLAIFMGGIGALVPEKMKTLSKVGFKALIAATLACMMTASVAGMFYGTGLSILF